jgi:hypothetical protein
MKIVSLLIYIIFVESQCVSCPESYYNPVDGGSCKKCPVYTYPS